METTMIVRIAAAVLCAIVFGIIVQRRRTSAK
jgi:hypothetical protein